VFILRRFIFITIGFYVKKPVFQFFSLMALNYWMTIYITANRPLTRRFDNRLAILNEYLVNLCSMLLPCFTDQIQIGTQSTYGWALVLLTASLCFVNMLIVICMIAKYIFLVANKHYNRKCGKKKEKSEPVQSIPILPIGALQ
jgi:hypothetical protein